MHIAHCTYVQQIDCRHQHYINGVVWLQRSPIPGGWGGGKGIIISLSMVFSTCHVGGQWRGREGGRSLWSIPVCFPASNMYLALSICISRHVIFFLFQKVLTHNYTMLHATRLPDSSLDLLQRTSYMRIYTVKAELDLRSPYTLTSRVLR